MMVVTLSTFRRRDAVNYFVSGFSHLYGQTKIAVLTTCENHFPNKGLLAQ